MWNTIFKHEVHRKINKRGMPFIGLLLQSGNVEVLRLLFNYPLKPNLRHVGPNADTPLHYICKQSWQGKENFYEECMVWLLENEEVDVHAFNCDFKTPLDLAKEMVTIVCLAIKHICFRDLCRKMKKPLLCYHKWETSLLTKRKK